MKKYLSLLALLSLMSSTALAEQLPSLSGAIRKYKGANYVGCIQDTQDITKKDPSNALAYYYMAISYANIGKKEDAVSAYEKVVALATDGTLVEYAQKGSGCLTNPEGCSAKAEEGLDDNDLERFIRSGEYFSKETVDKLHEIKTLQMKNQLNKEADKLQLETVDTKSEAPTNDEIAEAVKVLARAGFSPAAVTPYMQAQQAMYQNPEYMQMQMLMGNGYNSGNDFMSNMMPYFLAQRQNGTAGNNLSQDMIKNMMMSSMIGSVNTTFDLGGRQ